MLAPLAAWVAIRGELAWPPVVLGAAVLLWVAGFDVLYACQDFDFDVAMRLRSVPARLGIARALRVAAACHAAMVLVLAALPAFFPAFGWIYLTGVAAIAMLLVYEHALVRPDDLSRVNRAFFHVNAVVSLGLLAAGLTDLIW
jgi:4-hydroxybenzoate polyprenyltransferase